MAFCYDMWLHGGDAGEDFEELGMAVWGHLAEEEKFVHWRRGGREGNGK